MQSGAGAAGKRFQHRASPYRPRGAHSVRAEGLPHPNKPARNIRDLTLHRDIKNIASLFRRRMALDLEPALRISIVIK